MIQFDEEKTIHLTRGDETNDINILPISFENRTFNNDKLTLIVFDKKGYRQEPILKKEYEVSEGDTFNLVLTHEDTMSFPLTNKKKTYWYDLILNDYTTMYGFDEDNAKKFIVYPGGVIDD